MCHGAGLALRAHTEGGRRHEFEPPLTIAVLGDAEGAAEGVVTIVDSVSSTTVPYAHAWSSQLVDASEPALPGIEARWGIEMRSVLYVGDAHEPAQQTRTRWLIGDGIAVVAERIALLDDDEVRDEAVSLERD